MSEHSTANRADITLGDLRERFPYLLCNKDTAGLFFAWSGDEPVGRAFAGPGECAADLRDQIIAAERLRAEGSSSGP